MRFSKGVLLFAALMAAVGVFGVADDASALVDINTVTIKTPADSGAIRGIDSLIVVEVELLSLGANAETRVAVWLIGDADTSLVTDGNSASPLDTADAAKADYILIQEAAKKTAVTTAGGTAAATSVAFAQQRLGASTETTYKSGAPAYGDGPSLVVSFAGSLPKFTWKYRLSPGVGTVTGIRAAAVAVDPTDNSYSTVKTSATSLKLNLDGDRPSDAALATAGGLLVPTNFVNTDLNSDGDFLDISTGNVQESVLFNTGPGASAATFAGTSRPVLGIGDSLRFRIDLGTAGVPVVFGDSLRIVGEMLGKVFDIDKTRRPTTQSTIVDYVKVLAAGDFTSSTGANAAPANHTVAVYLVDQAGNRSARTAVGGGVANPDATSPWGVTAAATFVVDTVLPTLADGVAAGDTLLPSADSTITDGGLNTGVSNDLRPLTYQLAEALDTLWIGFDGKVTLQVNQGGATRTNTQVSLSTGARHTVNFTSIGNIGPAAAALDTFQIVTAGSVVETFAGGATTGAAAIKYATAADTQITTGAKTITFRGRDLAGNLGPVVSRANVYVDVDDLEFKRLFPTTATSLATIEKVTARVVFALSEAADSVLIRYTGTAGADKDSTRKRALSGPELATLTEVPYTVPGLVHNTSYKLEVIGADLAGNYTLVEAGTFLYDTTFVVPVIHHFTVVSSPRGLGSPVAAGGAVTLSLKAETVDNKVAVTYKGASVLKVLPGTGVTLTGTGVTDLGNGRATLSTDDWVVGTRSVTLKDTSSADTLSIVLQDCTDAAKVYTGADDSVIVIQAAARSKIIVDAPEEVGQGDRFWVDVTYADQYGNVRVTDNGFVSPSASLLGVETPSEVQIVKGIGGFWANSPAAAGQLIITARDIVVPTGDVARSSTDTIMVIGDGAVVLDAPGIPIGQDYMGAKGLGDQGGFVTLTFEPSDDHSTLTGYRIYREVAVFSDYNTADPPALVELAEPVKKYIPWGMIDAVPGEDPVRVVVATLDGDSTLYAVAAERGPLTTAKSAFAGSESVAEPYEMLAETMQQSREAVTEGPLFAALTPEAMAYAADGIVPRMKLIDGVERSSLAKTASAVRAIDNIAPLAVGSVRTMDTPDDAGSSITVTWTKSPSDQLLTQIVPQAIGGNNVYTTSGVHGYNIYRKVGDAAYALVGSATAGETSFVDQTAINGVRYTYQVRPFDADNITASEIEKSAMAIRNKVFDASGAPVYGLFGADNKVDLDDFFIFADHFGLSAGQETFDRAFDLVPNNKVDLDDFFAFADNFGRQIVGSGKVVPMLAGLNSDARFYLDAGSDLPRVGEELVVDVNLENYVELQGYGFDMTYDASVLEFVGARVDNNLLGEGQLAQPVAIAQGAGTVSLGAYGDVATKGDLGVSLVFRTLEEIEASYIEITSGALQDGSYGLNTVPGPVSVRIETRPEVYALSDNYPNPFNPETTIKYQLPEAGDVTLEVYNMLGQVVRTLVNEQQNAGRYVYQWDATNNAGQPLGSGIYFYRIQAGGEFQSVKKMLLLK